MHTAICTFDDRSQAQAAVDRLLQAGFDRNDVHLQYRMGDGSPVEKANDAWDSMEREVAVDRHVLENFGNFFASLFGQDDPAGHGSTYTNAVDRGYCVVVVDAASDAEAGRAQGILQGMEAAEMNVVHRSSQMPLREIVAARVAGAPEQRLGAARSELDTSFDREARREEEPLRERATASQGWGEQRTLEIKDQPEPDDATHAPGLRYADQDDKPR